MQIKKETLVQVESIFDKNVKELRHKILLNKREIKKLAKEQASLKRTCAALDKLHWEIVKTNNLK